MNNHADLAPIHLRVLERARRQPDALAVQGTESLTYRELVERSAQLARTLRRLGARSERLTALLLERSPALVTASLAALRSGGAYLPIDPAQPADRVRHILGDSGAGVLVTTAALLRRFPDLPVPAGGVLLLDEPLPASEEPLPEAPASPDSLAYVIYTSGSTGLPKGTELSHRGLSNLCAWHDRMYGLTPDDRCGLIAGPGFDASIFEIWPALAAGASLHVPPPDLLRNPPELLAWLAERRITHTFVPTPLAELLIRETMPAGLVLRTLAIGGDRLHRRPPAGLPFALVNNYGPTEVTVVSTAGVIAPEDVPGGGGAPDLGRPVDNLRVYILDGRQQPVSGEEPGELCIAGPQLARGYRARPDLTAAAFVPDPFAPADAPGDRMYRSGDLVRRLADGSLDFLGRIDRQIKIRGYRIELGEIESALARQPEVREATVLVRPGESRLTAYVSLREAAAEAGPAAARKTLRESLARTLPEAMVPAAWAFLDSLPVTPNGKVDRKILEHIEPEEVAEEGDHAPLTATEELVAGLFAQVLDLAAEPGREDDFFHLGGHSLLANRVAFRLREVFGVAPEVAQIFELATVERLADWIDEALRQDTAQAPPPERLARAGAAPLSFPQESLWFLDRLRPGMATYNLAQVSAFPGRVDAPALAAALREVLRRHEALRTSFVLPPGVAEPVQWVIAADALPWVLPVADLGGLPAEAREAEAARLVALEARRPYDLAQAPLLRALLIRLGETDRLFLGMHHIASDGWSMGVLHRELSALYRVAAAGAPSPLPELPLQMSDFAVWQREWLTGERLDGRLAWWRDRLAGAPTLLELPADRPRPAAPSERGAVEELPLGAPVERDLAAFGRRRGATPFMTLLAAFQAVLRRFTGQADFLVGSPVANRSWEPLEGMIGYFVNLLPLRAGLSDDPSLEALAARVRAGVLGAFAHQDLPFERLVEALAPERDLSHTPLVQISFALQEELPPLDFAPGLAACPAAVPTGTAKLDLSLFLERRGDGFVAIAEYATDLFEAATIRRLLESFRTLLAGGLAAPEVRVSELPLLSAAEREHVLAAAAGLPTGVPAAPVHRLVAEQARLRPDALAVDDGSESLTYGELVARARGLAGDLRQLGVGPESLVALLLERSARLVVSALATLEAGGAYLPIDPAQPADRILYMLRDSGARVLVTTPERRGQLPELPESVLAVIDTPAVAAAAELEPAPATLDNLAYVIYTSGSTGLPKGTELTHRGLANLCAWHKRVHGLTPEDRATLIAGPGFDASVFEMWPALVSGASLHVPPKEVILHPPTLAAWLAAHRVRFAFLPTPLADAILGEPLPADLALRTVLTGGDRLHRRPAPGTPFVLVNNYGPTETTVTATSGVTASESGQAHAPDIGGPVDNLRVHVLDRALHLVPAGVPGELFIAGISLSRGYRGRPDLTADRFIPDPFAEDRGARLYRTGDLVRLLPDGALDFLGRIDRQIKIRGFRIEPGEIEAALEHLPEVREAAVLVRQGESRLSAYVVPRDGAASAGARESLRETLRKALSRSLPEAMVPSAWLFLDALPLTPNGKVDRRALERMEPMSAGEEGAGAAPRTLTEQLLAGLFAQVLGLDAEPGVHDDFFHLGGHSLMATRLAFRIREVFGIEMEVARIFERATVERLAARIDEAVHQGEPLAPPPSRADRSGSRSETAPLSFAQQRLWFLERLLPGSTVYNIPVRFRIAGPGLRVEALAAAIQEVTHRHDALRTVLRQTAQGDAVQVILPFAPRPLPVADLSGLPAELVEAEAGRAAMEAATVVFDLARGPLLHTLLIRRRVSDGEPGGEEHDLMINLHHAVSDGWSMGVLTREISALYHAFAAGLPSPLPALPLQYADYAFWQQEQLAEGAMDAELAWWKRTLAGEPPTLELPTDFVRPPAQTFRGAFEQVDLGALTGPAERLGRQQGATLFMTLLAAFQTLLHRVTGLEDVWIGSPVANRDHGELEELIGLFVNTVVLRTDLSGEPTFAALLARVRETALAAFAHQDLPFEKLVEELAPQRDLSRTPLFQAFFSVQAEAPLLLELGDGLSGPLEEVRPANSKFDFSLYCWRGDGGLRIGAEYSTDLFEPVTARRMLGHFGTLLAEALAVPGTRLADLPLLTAAETAQIALWHQETHRGRPAGALLHGLFETQARRTPDSIALVVGGKGLTYRDLDERSARLARCLRRLGVGPEVPVAVCLERSADLVVALLGVLRAGGFYVPLDPAHPADRLAFLLEDSRCAVLLGGDRLADLPETPGAAALRLRVEEGIADDVSIEAPAEIAVEPGHLAYLIYTSGSTGRPKAVAIEHRSAAAMVEWARETFSAEELAGVVAPTSVTFDLSVFEIFVPLAVGGTVILVDNALAVPALNAPGALPDGVEARLINTVPSAIDELLRARALPASIRTVNLAGEALPRALADRVYERPETERLFNLYGPSEDTTYSTFALVERSGRRIPAIGRPVDDTRAHVVDRGIRPLPVGVPGELCLAGAGLARGYLRRPELTAERFLPDPFGTIPGARIYRTGDLVRRRSDGSLEYLGRLDHQVKIRGFRIELGEVEAALAAVPGVTGAVVVAREGRLAGYLVAGGDLAAADVRKALSGRLPEVMIPADFVFLEAFPLSPNGKIDRKALPAPEAGSESPYVAPRTEVEREVAEIWQSLLGVEQVGVEDSFWQLGGHSLLAMRLMSRVRDRFGVEMEVRTLFERSTVEHLAALIEQAAGTTEALVPAPSRMERSGPAPLSFSQQRLWFLDRLQPGTATYNISQAWTFSGPVDPAALAGALHEIVRRHEALRTRFALTAEESDPVQVVEEVEALPWMLPVVDLAALPEELRTAEADRLGHEEAGRPWDLTRAPLIRTALLRLGAQDRLVAGMHHIVSDGWSVEVFLRELSALYQSAAPLPELPLQYADYAVWQRRWLSDERLEGRLRWWEEHLAGAPTVLELPADRPRPAVASQRGALAEVPLGPGIDEAIDARGREAGATRFMVLFAAFQALLSRVTGQDDLLVGSPVANRPWAELEDLIGFFVNFLPLRADLSGNPGLDALIGRVRQETLGAYGHQDIPFERLVESLAPERDLSRAPLVQVVFSVPGTPPVLDLGGGLTARAEELPPAAAKFDLTLFIECRPHGLSAMAEYATDLFDAATVERLLGGFRVLLHAALAHPGMPLSELPLLEAAELSQILAASAGPVMDVSGVPLHLQVLERARLQPHALAVESDTESLTYGELVDRASRLAGRLHRLGLGPEDLAALLVERSPTLVVAALAVMISGAAYLPIDPAVPAERALYMLRDSGARALLTTAALLEEWDGAPLPGLPVVHVDDRDLAWEEPPAPFAQRPLEPENLAYVIYTSGSTGLPKGTEVSHANLANFCAMFRGTWGVTAEDRSPLIAGPGFDASVMEMWPTLSAGGSVHVPAPRTVLDSGALLAWFRDRRISITFLATPLGDGLLAEAGGDPEALPDLRVLLIGGERLLRRPDPGLRFELVNVYGPTECTILSTGGLVEPEGERAPDIGRPLANLYGYVLDQGLTPVPVGVPGELCIGGAGVVRGYRGRPALTAERFVPDPAGPPGARIYRSGDRVRRLPDGNIDYLDRLDRQVKIRGIRIELGEIETTLAACEGVEAAVVQVREDRPGDRRLVAWVVGSAKTADLREALRARLTEAMVPSAFVRLDALPLNPNGKLDRRALPAPEAELSEAETFVAPRTELEEQVAQIWRDVLRVERIGIDDSVWDLGGHSLLATKILIRVESTFGVQLPLQALFTSPRLAEFAALVGQSMIAAEGEEMDDYLADLAGLSEEEIRELLAREVEV